MDKMVFKCSKVIIIVFIILTAIGCKDNNANKINNQILLLQNRIDSLNKQIAFNIQLIDYTNRDLLEISNRLYSLELKKTNIIKKYDKEINDISNITNDSIRDIYRSRFFDNDTTFPKDIDIQW